MMLTEQLGVRSDVKTLHRVSRCLSWFEIDDKAVLARRVHGKTDLNPAFALRLKHLNLSARQVLAR
jgi:hypothetical protein